MVETTVEIVVNGVKIDDDVGETTTVIISTNGSVDDHYNPSVRVLSIPKLENGSCGFHLSRSKWDPYPWVSRVDKESPAEITGLKIGDCVLEVNGEDVIGLRIVEVANIVRSVTDQVSLLLWSTGLDPICNPDSLCCGPMPLNLERLSASMSTILAALECPICLDTIPPPVLTCPNGHLICATCRQRAEKCPICREKYSPGRCLIAEQVYNSVTDAFNLREQQGKLREKLFGANCKKSKDLKNSIEHFDKPSKSYTLSFLSKIMGKAASVDNLNNQTKENSITVDSNILKLKSLSLSTNEIFRSDIPISITRCPSQGNFSNKRPSSCNVSTENLSLIIPVPVMKLFYCPCGENCEQKLKSNDLNRHISEIHKMVVISFGFCSAEISLPPRTPVENACLVLNLENSNFWLRLDTRPYKNGDIFTSALLQGGLDECSNYMLEVVIRNSESNKILQKELIARSAVYSLENMSWNNIVNSKKGVFFSSENIKFSFDENAELLLKVCVKNVADM